MNKEIKEIIEDIKKHLEYNEEDYKKGAVDSTRYEIYCGDLRMLSNYITNLEKENGLMKTILYKKWEEKYDNARMIKIHLYKYTPEKGFELVGGDE